MPFASSHASGSPSQSESPSHTGSAAPAPNRSIRFASMLATTRSPFTRNATPAGRASSPAPNPFLPSTSRVAPSSFMTRTFPEKRSVTYSRPHAAAIPPMIRASAAAPLEMDRTNSPVSALKPCRYPVGSARSVSDPHEAARAHRDVGQAHERPRRRRGDPLDELTIGPPDLHRAGGEREPQLGAGLVIAEADRHGGDGEVEARPDLAGERVHADDRTALQRGEHDVGPGGDRDRPLEHDADDLAAPGEAKQAPLAVDRVEVAVRSGGDPPRTAHAGAELTFIEDGPDRWRLRGEDRSRRGLRQGRDCRRGRRLLHRGPRDDEHGACGGLVGVLGGLAARAAAEHVGARNDRHPAHAQLGDAERRAERRPLAGRSVHPEREPRDPVRIGCHAGDGRRGADDCGGRRADRHLDRVRPSVDLPLRGHRRHERRDRAAHVHEDPERHAGAALQQVRPSGRCVPELTRPPESGISWV